MTTHTISSQNPAEWAEKFASLYSDLKPYRKLRSVITIRNNSSSTLILEAAFVSDGVFASGPGTGEPLKPGEVRLISVKTTIGMPGYETYGIWKVASPSKGDSFVALVACRWKQPKSFRAVTPPDVRVGLTSLYEFNAFLKKTSFGKLKHKDIECGPSKTQFGQVRQIIKETAYTTKGRAGIVVTGISAVNSEFVIADVEKSKAPLRKKPKRDVRGAQSDDNLLAPLPILNLRPYPY
jgi:hypothetical protein